MLKPETKFWLQTGWNELFHRYDAYGPYIVVGFGCLSIIFLVVGLPYLVFGYIMKIQIALWIWILLGILGYLLSLLVSIRIAYILYIRGFQ